MRADLKVTGEAWERVVRAHVRLVSAFWSAQAAVRALNRVNRIATVTGAHYPLVYTTLLCGVVVEAAKTKWLTFPLEKRRLAILSQLLLWRQLHLMSERSTMFRMHSSPWTLYPTRVEVKQWPEEVGHCFEWHFDIDCQSAISRATLSSLIYLAGTWYLTDLSKCSLIRNHGGHSSCHYHQWLTEGFHPSRADRDCHCCLNYFCSDSMVLTD